MTFDRWISEGKQGVLNAAPCAALLLFFLFATAGCGGGGNGSENLGGGANGLVNTPVGSASPASGNDDASRFVPNYATELTHARHWNKANLTVRIVAPTDPAQSRNGLDYVALIGRGEALWKPHTNAFIKLVNTTAGGDADITVTFVAPNSLPNGAIGRTEVMYGNDDNVLISANIKIDGTLTPDTMAQVAAHELGHALGLEGHSRDEADLMFVRSHLPANVTARDANTISWNYRNAGSRAAASRKNNGVSVAVSNCVWGDFTSPRR